MAFASNTLDFVRGFFKEQDYKRPPFVPVVGYGGMTTTSPYFSYGLPSGTMSGLTDYLRIDSELVSRFIDYEDQDDSPLISSSLDIYSDESTQVDSQTGFSVNIKCENEAIRQSLHDLFHKRLRIEESIWQHVRLLCKYGNNEAEIVAKDQVGVIALNALPAPTVRRIELPKQIGMGVSFSEATDTLGFLYDPTGLFKITTQEFIQDLNKRSGSSDGLKQTSQEGKQTGCVTFEGWEVMHMRLLGKNPNSIYGFGIGEPARWIFKRLMLLEDSIILHRLCLRGDTNVWTTSGYKKIKDLNEGDEVYSYGKDLKLKKTKVVYKKHNGVDKIYRIRSKHREIYANATHPVLVEIEHHQGSGKPILRGMEYVEVKNLIPGKHKFVTPMVGDEHAEIVELKLPEVPKKSRIKSGHFILNRPKYLFKIGIDCGVEYGRLKQFIRGEKWLPEKTAKLVTSSLGLDGDCLETVEDWGNLRQVRIPKNPTVEFARLFGFMIGDGFIAQKRHKNGYLAKNSVGIALGDSEEFNSKYMQLFRDFFGDGYLSYKNGRKNSYSVNSKLLYEFFELNGYVRGAENKRVPEWIYRSNQEIKRAFIDGLVDADGHRKESRSQGMRDVELSQSISLEMCNEALLVDVRELCMQLGFSVGQKINKRERPGGHLIEDRLMPATTSYTLHFSLKEYNQEREIISIDQVEDDDIWDIGVEADEHNFIANGVVVHNTRAPSRYAFYVDVSQIPPNETTAYLNKVKQSIKKQKFVNPNGNKMDQKYNVLCLSLDTKIPVLSGFSKTLRELICDYENGIQNWTYSIDPVTKIVKPGKISWAGITRKNAELVKVCLDNGRYEIVTPDHKFLLRDGTYVQAKDLTTGTSLMPFNRFIHNGREQVNHPGISGKHSWEQTHRMVAHGMCNKLGKKHVHHKDHDKLNNNPENLEALTQYEHQKLHASDPNHPLNIIRHTPEWKAKIAETNRKYQKFRFLMRYNKSEKHSKDNAIRSRSLKRLFKERRAEMCEAMRYKYPDGITEILFCVIQKNPAITIDNICVEVSKTDWFKKYLELNPRKKRNQPNIKRHGMLSVIRNHGFDGFADLKEKALFNHKVVKVEVLSYREDTGCITVDKWHNFAVDSGVFVKNSSDDDFFLPTREGRESTRVESLAGPIYDHIEDIRFFENKLFAALKVPKPFLTYEETTAKTHLSAEDARFARTIIRIQREVRNGLRKVARVHLAAIGVNPDAVDFDITMTIPSAIFELAQLEIRSAELDLAEKFSAWADRDWIMHNILNFSDQQITEMQKKKKQEEMAGEESPKGSASGDLDKALSKRGQQVLPSKPENASTVYRKGILVNSHRRKNTEYLKERIEEERLKDPAFDQRWSEVTGLMNDLKDALGK